MKKLLPLLALVGVGVALWYLFTPSGDPVVPPEGGPAVPVSPARRLAGKVSIILKPGAAPAGSEKYIADSGKFA